MTCREASSLLPLFLDGELDARQMRAVALHGTRCATCEAELRHMEHLQELVAGTIRARVDQLDFRSFWAGIESRLIPRQDSWGTRVRAWWAERESSRVVAWSALAAAAAGALFALLFFTRVQQPSPQPSVPQVASVDIPVSIDSLDTDVDSVAVVNDPETRTTVLWVSDDKVVDGAVP